MMRETTRWAARAVAAAALGVLLAVATAVPASAHDELIGADPAADSTVAALPAAITLTFSQEVLAEQGAAQVQATGADGTDLVAGEIVVSGTTVTAPLAGDAVGAVQVLWRAVSSDGHPISGEFAFTVSPPATPDPDPATTSAPTVEPPVATATPSPDAADTDPVASAVPIVAVVVGIVVVGLLGAAVAVLVRVARRPGGRGPDGA